MLWDLDNDGINWNVDAGKPAAGGPSLTFESNVRLPAKLQIITFIAATILIIVYGIKALAREATPTCIDIDND
jgi:hypothetical protein